MEEDEDRRRGNQVSHYGFKRKEFVGPFRWNESHLMGMDKADVRAKAKNEKAKASEGWNDPELNIFADGGYKKGGSAKSKPVKEVMDVVKAKETEQKGAQSPGDGPTEMELKKQTMAEKLNLDLSQLE